MSITLPFPFIRNNVLELSSGIDDLGAIRWQLLLCLFVAWVIIFLCICKGTKSTGKVVYLTVTLPYIILTILLIRGATLPGAAKGILYFIKPDFKLLLKMQVSIYATVSTLTYKMVTFIDKTKRFLDLISYIIAFV